MDFLIAAFAEMPVYRINSIADRPSLGVTHLYQILPAYFFLPISLNILQNVADPCQIPEQGGIESCSAIPAQAFRENRGRIQPNYYLGRLNSFNPFNHEKDIVHYLLLYSSAGLQSGTISARVGRCR